LHSTYSGQCLEINKLVRYFVLFFMAACSSTVSLGVEYGGSLPDSSFKASSNHYFSMYRPSNGRLNSGGAWCAMGLNEFLEIDLGSTKHLCGVSTQGSNVFDDWLTKYLVRYSSDGISWTKIFVDGQEKVRFTCLIAFLILHYDVTIKTFIKILLFNAMDHGKFT